MKKYCFGLSILFKFYFFLFLSLLYGKVLEKDFKMNNIFLIFQLFIYTWFPIEYVILFFGIKFFYIWIHTSFISLIGMLSCEKLFSLCFMIEFVLNKDWNWRPHEEKEGWYSKSWWLKSDFFAHFCRILFFKCAWKTNFLRDFYQVHSSCTLISLIFL